MRLHLAFSYQEADRFHESFALMRECKRVFAVHGDKRMLLITGITEGALLQRLGKFRRAREAYLLLLVPEKPDFESEAALRITIQTTGPSDAGGQAGAEQTETTFGIARGQCTRRGTAVPPSTREAG